MNEKTSLSADSIAQRLVELEYETRNAMAALGRDSYAANAALGLNEQAGKVREVLTSLNESLFRDGYQAPRAVFDGLGLKFVSGYIKALEESGIPEYETGVMRAGLMSLVTEFDYQILEPKKTSSAPFL